MNSLMRGCLTLLLSAVALATTPGCGESSTNAAVVQDLPAQDEPSPLASADRSYAAILKAVVTSDGLVRYDVLAKPEQVGELRKVVLAYATTRLPTCDDDKLAFLCNAYNANVLNMVVKQTASDLFKSVKDVPGFFDEVTITVAGEKMTLNDLENKHVRPMGDPRIHAALVCAAISCPPLRSEPYVGDRLDEQLADQARRWINDKAKNRVDERGLGVSRLMQWYEDDFAVAPYGGVIGFARAFAEPTGPIGRLLSREDDPPLHFLEYDWSLNRARPG